MPKIFTASFIVDDDVDTTKLENTIQLFNEGATDEHGIVSLGGQVFKFEEIEHVTLVDVPDEDIGIAIPLTQPMVEAQ